MVQSVNPVDYRLRQDDTNDNQDIISQSSNIVLYRTVFAVTGILSDRQPHLLLVTHQHS